MRAVYRPIPLIMNDGGVIVGGDGTHGDGGWAGEGMDQLASASIAKKDFDFGIISSMMEKAKERTA